MNDDVVNSREDYIKELKRVIWVMILGLLGLKFLEIINSNSTEIWGYTLVKSVMLISVFNITDRIMAKQYIKIRLVSLFMIIPTLIIIYLLDKYCDITYEFAQGIFDGYLDLVLIITSVGMIKLFRILFRNADEKEINN